MGAMACSTAPMRAVRAAAAGFGAGVRAAAHGGGAGWGRSIWASRTDGGVAAIRAKAGTLKALVPAWRGRDGPVGVCRYLHRLYRHAWRCRGARGGRDPAGRVLCREAGDVGEHGGPRATRRPRRLPAGRRARGLDDPARTLRDARARRCRSTRSARCAQAMAARASASGGGGRMAEVAAAGRHAGAAFGSGRRSSIRSRIST